jgi:hypothetical protein
VRSLRRAGVQTFTVTAVNDDAAGGTDARIGVRVLRPRGRARR